MFRDYSGAGKYAVLALQPLDEQEAIEILANRGIERAEAFLAEANARRMGWMISNPQNLITLADVVADSGWPTTKSDLFEQWSLRQLTERKESLHDSQLGSYAPADLMDASGAACAVQLTSDATGIRRGPTSDDQVPSY